MAFDSRSTSDRYRSLALGCDPAKAFAAAMAKEHAARIAGGYAFPKGPASPVEYEAPAFRRNLLEG